MNMLFIKTQSEDLQNNIFKMMLLTSFPDLSIKALGKISILVTT